MAKSQRMVIHVAFDLELNHDAHDRHPAPHDHDDGREHVNPHDPSVLCRGIHRNTNGMNIVPLRIR